jgi:thioredoxin reductase (NADPH)
MPEKNSYDVVILGTGPAGLQAAIHAARKKVTVIVSGKQSKSGIFQHHLANYCCVFNTTGEDIISTGWRQAAGFGDEAHPDRQEDEDQRARHPCGGEYRWTSLAGGQGRGRGLRGRPGSRQLCEKGLERICDLKKGQKNDMLNPVLRTAYTAYTQRLSEWLKITKGSMIG